MPCSRPDRNLVRLELAALDFRGQPVAASKQVGYSSIVSVAPTSRKGFGAREGTNCLFRDAWFRDLACVPSRVHVDHNLQIGFKLFRPRLTDLPQTNRKTVARPSPALRLSKPRILRTRQGPRSNPSCEADPLHPSRTISKRAGHYGAPGEAERARSHRFGRCRSPWRHSSDAAGEALYVAGAPSSSGLNFVYHNVNRQAHKPRYRRVEWYGNPQVSATRFRFGKRTALAPHPLFRCRHCAALIVPRSASSMRFARPRFNRSPPARLQPD